MIGSPKQALVLSLLLHGFTVTVTVTAVTLPVRTINHAPPSSYTTDIVVFGATAGGVLASIAAARRGANTALLCTTWPDCWPPSNRVGGLTTGGLGTTDSCHQVSLRVVCYTVWQAQAVSQNVYVQMVPYLSLIHI